MLSSVDHSTIMRAVRSARLQTSARSAVTSPVEAPHSAFGRALSAAITAGALPWPKARRLLPAIAAAPSSAARRGRWMFDMRVSWFDRPRVAASRDVSASVPLPGDDERLCSAPTPRMGWMTERLVECFSPLSSPWMYFAGPQLRAIADRHGARVLLRPYDFQDVVPRTGGIPLRTRPRPRQDYHALELDRWARH